MEGAQLKSPGHGNVRQGGGAEAEATVGGRGKEEHGGGLSVLWDTFGGVVGF